jgi:hypothetical protein
MLCLTHALGSLPLSSARPLGAKWGARGRQELNRRPTTAPAPPPRGWPVANARSLGACCSQRQHRAPLAANRQSSPNGKQTRPCARCLMLLLWYLRCSSSR